MIGLNQHVKFVQVQNRFPEIQNQIVGLYGTGKRTPTSVGNEELGDPKCWLCAAVNKPGKIYGPNICVNCLPSYKERKFVFVRPSQEEMDELFK